jgi:hypothetical protein
MASVRMSEKLREEIMNNAHKIFSNSAEKAQASLPELFHDRAIQEYYTAAFKLYIDKIPAEWKNTVNKISYKMEYVLANDSLKTIQHMTWSEVAIIKPVTIPMLHLIYRETYGGTRICNIPNTFDFSDELKTELGFFRDRCRKVADEEESFCNNLKAILRRTNTLKQFTDVWPQGENLIPAYALAALNEKTTRVKKDNDQILSEEVSKSLSTTLLKRTLMS